MENRRFPESRDGVELDHDCSRKQEERIKPKETKDQKCNNNLKSALFSHLDEKRYKCNICEKKFLCKSKVARHMVTHTGEKPHKCGICEKSFALKETLKRHIRTHTGEEKPLICKICKLFFERQSNLIVHIKSHHVEDYEDKNSKADSTSRSKTKCDINLEYQPDQQEQDPLKDSSRIQEEKKRINLKITPVRSEDCNEVVEQQQKRKRSTLIPSKRIGIDLRKIKWDQKYEEDLEIEASESDQETLSIIEIESESEPDPEPRKNSQNIPEGKDLRRRRKVFVCNDCGLKVSHIANFKRHIKTHNREQILDCECEVREKKIPRKSSSSILLIDLETNTVAVPNKCDTSENKFGQNRSMRTSSFSCPRCSEHTFLKESEFLEHIKKHHIVFKCGLCESVFQRQSNLTVHLRSHTSQNVTSLQSSESETEPEAQNKEQPEQHNEPIELNLEHAEKSAPKESSKNFEETAQVKVSRGSKKRFSLTGDAPCYCQICDKMFSDKNILTRHLRIHTGEKTLQCKVCNQAFSRLDSLNRHMRRFHTKQTLSKTKQSFVPKSHLTRTRRHMRSHTEEKSIKCPICSKTFTRTDSVTRHMHLLHAKEIVSSKRETNKCDLNSNSRVKKRQLECKIRKSFIRASELTRNILEAEYKSDLSTDEESEPKQSQDEEQEEDDDKLLLHHKEKGQQNHGPRPKSQQETDCETDLYECNRCDKTFVWRHSLKEHTKTHKKLPFYCSRCGKTFSDSWKFSRHMKIHMKNAQKQRMKRNGCPDPELIDIEQEFTRKRKKVEHDDDGVENYAQLELEMEQDLEVDSAIVQGHAAGNGPGMVIYNEGVNDLEMESENDLSNDQELQIEGDHDSDPELVNDHAVGNDPGMVINNEEVNDLETGTKNDQELQIEGDHESDHELSGKELGSELDPQAAPGTLIEEEPQPVPGTLIEEEPQPVPDTLIEEEHQPVPGTLIEEEPQPVPGTLIEEPQPVPGTLIEEPQPVPGTLIEEEHQPVPGTLIDEEPQSVPGTLIEEPQPVPGTLIDEEPQPVPGTLIEEEPQPVPGTLIEEEPQAAPDTLIEEEPQAVPDTLIEEEPQPVPGTLIEEPQPVLGTLIEEEHHPVPDTLIEEEHFELVKNHSQENENTSKENHLMLENKCGEENEIYSKIILTPENYLDFSDLDFDNEDINYQLVRIPEH